MRETRRVRRGRGRGGGGGGGGGGARDEERMCGKEVGMDRARERRGVENQGKW